MSANPVFDLLAKFGDLISAEQLRYKHQHEHGDESRFQAGARIASTEGGVKLWSDWGYATVISDDTKRPEPYDVCFLSGGFACPCRDSSNNKLNPSAICKHISASTMVASLFLTESGIAIHKVASPVELVKLMSDLRFTVTRASGRRLIMQKAVSLNGQVIDDVEQVINPPSKPILLEVGKHHKVVLEAG